MGMLTVRMAGFSLSAFFLIGCSKQILPGDLCYVALGAKPRSDIIVAVRNGKNRTRASLPGGPGSIEGLSASGDRWLISIRNLRTGKFDLHRYLLQIGHGQQPISEIYSNHNWEAPGLLSNAGHSIFFLTKDQSKGEWALNILDLNNQSSKIAMTLPSQSVAYPKQWYKILGGDTTGQSILLLKYELKNGRSITELYRADTLKSYVTRIGETSQNIVSAAFSPSANEIVVLTGQDVEIWDGSSLTRRVLVSRQFFRGGYRANGLAWCPKDNMIYIPFFDSSLNTGELIRMAPENGSWTKIIDEPSKVIDFVTCF